MKMNSKQRKRKRQRGKETSSDTKRDDSREAENAPKQQQQQHRPVVPSFPGSTSINISHKKFLTATDGSAYHQLLREHYTGFAMVPAGKVHPPSFHFASKSALEKLRDAGYYQYDMVVAGGKNLSRTFVRRCLVGEPGITYKYLGLRLFAHAWSGPDVSLHFRDIFNMNQEMIHMTKEQLQQQLQPPGTHRHRGSCEYNLTLINYMDPACETVLKDEEFYGMGKASVSWHADSSLQDYSSIGVYHTLPTQKACTWDWKIALRQNPELDTAAATTAPVQPVVVPTKSGDLYFLLGEFNHTHQHMVLAGSASHRISSTHRVAVTATDTYEYIRDRCSTALKSAKAELKNKKSSADWNVPVLLEVQNVLTEVEFEWIAQYWIQGAQHDVQHLWWQAPIQALEQAWGALEKLTFKIYQRCITAAEAASDTPPPELVAGLLAAMQTRQDLRTKWDDRRSDKIYKRRISRPYQPVEHPVFATTLADDDNSTKRLSKDLTVAIQLLSRVLAAAKRGDNKGTASNSRGGDQGRAEKSNLPNKKGPLLNHRSGFKKAKQQN